MSDQEGLTLTDEEWDEIFNNPDEQPLERPRPWWVRWVALLAAVGVLIAGLTGVVSALREVGKISDPAEILATSQSFAQSSEWGWLVEEIRIVPIERANVGAFVIGNPADGVIHLDDRRWDVDALEELMAHEIGHLVDFAVYQELRPGSFVLRGGIEQEAWAECAAVHAGLRRLDGEGADQEYRCRPSELEVFRAEMSSLDQICRPWGEPECRPYRFDP